MTSPKKIAQQVSAWRTSPISPTIANAEALPAKMDKTVRKEHDEHTQEAIDCVEREFSKGQTRGIYTDERKEWIGRRKFPYGYKPVYVKDPDGLYFPEKTYRYTPLIFILDRQYDAIEHAVRFVRGNTNNELYGWTNNGRQRVHITSSGDTHGARIRTLRNPS